MIVVTGGGGFIGSALIWALNQQNYTDIISVDKLGMGDKWLNLAKRNFLYNVHTDNFFSWLKNNGDKVEAIFHMGACSSTTERDADFLMEKNFHYTRQIWQFCTDRSIPLIYASSAATYGDLEANFYDNHQTIAKLRPINKYGWSKQLFDHWAIREKKAPPRWFGLKFFNVYGPQEYHKDSQASVVYHAFPQVRDKGKLRLFKSYRQGVEHGEQARDFVYVKDVVKVMLHLWKSQTSSSGIYNLGTGTARTFNDLGRSVFQALDKKPSFEWIEMPENIRHQYQYYTQADLTKLQDQGGYQEPFTSLEAGITDYVQNYLLNDDPYF